MDEQKSNKWAVINKINDFEALENAIIYLGSIGKRCRIACAVPEEEPALLALNMVNELAIVHPILVGDKDKIVQLIDGLGLKQSEFDIVDEKDPIKACSKASLMVRNGDADILMKGLVSTSIVLHAAMDKETGLRIPGGMMSHVSVLQIPDYDRLIFITDAGLNIDPSLMEKKGIIENAIKVAHALGNFNPKIALLSATETINVKMTTSTDDAILSKMNERNQIKGGIVDGPLALDVAVSTHAAEHKKVKSNVAGCADILVVDNIDVGNVLLKSVMYFAHAKFAGMVIGATNPIVITSRSDTDMTKYYSILLAIIVDYQSKQQHII